MLGAPTSRSRTVLWPIVLGVCALMLVPAGGVLGSHPSTSLATAPTAVGTNAPSALNRLSDLLHLPVQDLVAGSDRARSLGAVGSGVAPSLAFPTTLRSPDATSGAPSPLVPTVASPETPGWVSAVARSIADGQLPASAAFLPSLNLLDDHVLTPSQAVSPTFTSTPAPMGIGDFGLGSGGPYTVYTPAVEGGLSLSGYNASGGSLYEDTGSYFFDHRSPNVASTPWQSSVQLNTVVTNVSYPGSDEGAFWTQNVVLFSGDTFQLVDNIWNLSSPNATMNPGTLLSYSGTLVPGELYYDYGPSFPVEFPLTIDLVNDASTLANQSSAVSFEYTIVEGTTPHQQVYSGTYDTVVFNSTPNLFEPLLTPEYQINGSSLAPNNMSLQDAELVFGGPGDGSNAVVSSLSGTLSLSYQNGSAWDPAPSAYDYGTDTGETSIGVAGTWSGSTETVTQGPSLLYGLWNTSAPEQAHSGSLSFAGHLEPTYGFAFIGLNGTNATNFSYAPSSPSGTVATELPPSIGGMAVYNLTAFADGFSELNTSFTGSQANFPIDLPFTGDTWNAPLYMDGPAQALSLAENATGSSSVPYTFSDLTVDVNLTFNHVNDFGYPEFDLLWASGVTVPLNVTNITQGPDSPNGNTSYALDFNASVVNLPEWGDQIAVWSGSNDVFQNLTLLGGRSDMGLEIGGGAVSLWNVLDAFATNITSLNGSFGVWAADSPGINVTDSEALFGGVVLSVLDSPQASATNLSSYFGGADVLDEGGIDGSFAGLNASASAAGFLSVWANDTTVEGLNATNGSLGAALEYGVDASVADVVATNGSLGVLGNSTVGTVVDDVEAINNSYFPGVEFLESSSSTVYDVYASGYASIGIYLAATLSATATAITAVNGSLGLFANDTSVALTVDNVTATGAGSIGAAVEDDFAPVSIADVSASNGSVGAVLLDALDASVSDVTATGANASASGGTFIINSSADTVANVLVSGTNSTGVLVDASFDITIRNTTASFGAFGVEVDPSHDVRVDGTTSLDGAVGVDTANSTHLWVSGTVAENRSVGFLASGDNWTTVNETDAVEFSLGVGIVGSNYTWANSTTASDFSIGVAADGASWLNVNGVTATDLVRESPWYGFSTSPFGVPVAAVVTEDTYQSTVTAVNATAYPAGLIDFYSVDLAVQSLNASEGEFAVVLNGTYGSTFSGIVAYGDVEGLLLDSDASYNLVTESYFLDSASYGVDIEYGSDNYVYLNDFVANNGATSVYNATHIQAFSDSPSNVFNSSGDVGNYWADWHAYADGVLLPYYVSNGAWDYHPIGAAAGTYAVTFYASGLASGASWSVTLRNGSFETTARTVGGWVTFDVVPGTYAFSVAAVHGYKISPSAGSLIVATGPVSQTIDFAALYTVSFVESGLPHASNWAVWFDGVEYASSNTTVALTVVGGTYLYSVVAPADYAAAPSSGSVEISANYTVPVAFSSTIVPPPPVETVYLNETGLMGSTSWSAVFNGVEESTALTSLEFNVTAGTYSYQVLSVSGYSVTPASGTVTVGGTYVISVSFTLVTYAVTITETGLSAGTVWTAYLNGSIGGSPVSNVETGAGPSMTFYVPNGRWTYSIESVSGYSLAHGSGTVVVNGAPAGASVGYTPSTTPAYVGQSSLNTDFEIALGIAVVALLVALVAVLRRPRVPPPPPAAQWQGPAEPPTEGNPPAEPSP